MLKFADRCDPLPTRARRIPCSASGNSAETGANPPVSAASENLAPALSVIAGNIREFYSHSIVPGGFEVMS
jgi:hypothetical protein